jgi:hypothetical protein
VVGEKNLLNINVFLVFEEGGFTKNQIFPNNELVITRPSKMEVYHRGLWEHKWLQMATWNDLNKWI